MTRNEIENILPGVYRIPVQLKGNPLKELNSYLISGQFMISKSGVSKRDRRSFRTSWNVHAGHRYSPDTFAF